MNTFAYLVLARWPDGRRVRKSGSIKAQNANVAARCVLCDFIGAEVKKFEMHRLRERSEA